MGGIRTPIAGRARFELLHLGVGSLREAMWVFVAGGCGASARVLLVGLIDKRLHEQLPYVGTLVVNLIGCIAIGLLSALLGQNSLRPIILGGLLGGFTTYSAFGLLTWDLLEQQRYWAFAAQVTVHIVAGLVCVWIGLSIGRHFAGPRPP